MTPKSFADQLYEKIRDEDNPDAPYDYILTPVRWPLSAAQLSIIAEQVVRLAADLIIPHKLRNADTLKAMNQMRELLLAYLIATMRDRGLLKEAE